MNNSEAILIKALEDICFPEEPWSLESLKSTLSREDILYRVIFGDGSDEPMGYYIAALSFDETELYRIAVVPDCRGKGYGKSLMEDFLGSCPKDISKVFLEVRESNKAAIGLYERFGFEEINRRRNYYGSEDAVIYLLNL